MAQVSRRIIFGSQNLSFRPVGLSTAGLVGAPTVRTGTGLEPGGYIMFARSLCDVASANMPTAPTSFPGWTGKWRLEQTVFTVFNATDAPASPTGTISIKYPTGFNSGHSPGAFSGWERNAAGNLVGKSAFYLRIHIRMGGLAQALGSMTTDWENQGVGTKLFYIAHGEPIGTGAHNTSIAMLVNNIGGQGIATTAPLQLRQQNFLTQPPYSTSTPPYKLNYPPNQGAPLFRFGVWNKMEFLCIQNDIGVANGHWEYWLNDVRAALYDTIVWRDSAHPAGFWDWQGHPVWGGNPTPPEVKVRDDYLLYDDIYMSA